MQQKLTLKQSAFCNEYMIDLNATQAAIRAGYSAKTASEQGSRLLGNVKVQTKLSELQKSTAAKHELSRDMVLLELKRLGFSDIRKLFNDDGTIKPIQKLDSDTAAAISSIDVDELEIGDVKVGQTKKLKLWSKISALESIAKILGFNAPEKLIIDYDRLSDDALDKIIAQLKITVYANKS